MRAFTAQQRALAASSTVQPILLVVLTTYSDRALGTVDTVYYLSDRPVLYDYGNTGTVRQFEALVLAVSDLTTSIPHVPGTTPAGLEAEARITLSNLPYRGGNAFVRELRAHNLEFATVEIATVYGPLDSASGWYDLRAYTGDEHIVELRAEVQMAEGIDAESFQLRVVTPEVTVPWVRADDATITDPKDLGTRLPVVYGHAKRVPCVSWQVGWTTTLTAALPETAGAGYIVEVTDATGFPTSAWTARINGEEIAFASRASSSDPIAISARAQSGTMKAEHGAGSVIVEVPAETVLVCAGATGGDVASAVNAVYLRNPYNSEIFRLAAPPTPDLARTDLVSGATCAAIAYDQPAMRQLMAESFASAQVAQQAEYSVDGSAASQDGTASAVSGWYGSVSGDYYGGTWYNVFNGSASSPQWAGGGAYMFRVSWRFTITGLPSAASTSIELRGNVTYNLAGATPPGPWGIWIFGSSIPYVPSLWAAASGGSSGSNAFSSGAIATGGTNFSAYNGGTIYVQPIVSANVVNDGAHYIGLSNLALRVTYQVAPDVYRTVDARVTAAGVGFGLDFYADVDGPAAPPTYVAGYGFEESSGWSASGCTVSADTGSKTEGTQSIKLTVDETEIESCDSGAGSWSATRCTATNDSGEKTRGTASMKLVATTPYLSSFAWREGLSPADWSGKVIAFDVRLTDAATWSSSGALTNTLGVRLSVTSSATYATDIMEWTFGLNAGLGGSWVTICFDPATYTGLYYSAGTLDLANVRGYGFVLQPPTATPALLEMRVDSLRLLPKTAIAQRNTTAGTVDLTADALGYRLATHADQRESFASGSKVYVSNTAGSGTTPPAARREIALDPSLIGDGAFATQEVTATDVGSPSVADVETVGVSIALPASPPQALLGPPVLRVDGLERRDDSASLYDAAVGDLIEHPADVTRHLLTARCGLADSYADTTTLTSWAANAPDVKLGVDLRALGETLPELLARIGYEGRANVLRAEGAATSSYKALCAEADYTWPASSGRALTQYQALSEVGRDGREIATRFQFVYDRDPSRGTDLAAYDGLLRSNPTVSDVSVSAATLATREQKYGRRDADVGVLLAHRDEASAQDVAGYYVAEAGRDAGTFVLRGCAWWEAADLELGDIVDVAPPWRAAPVKVRTIEMTRRFGAGVVDLRAVEVA